MSQPSSIEIDDFIQGQIAFLTEALKGQFFARIEHTGGSKRNNRKSQKEPYYPLTAKAPRSLDTAFSV